MHFYRLDFIDTSGIKPLASSDELSIWRPSKDGFPSLGENWTENLAWWMLDAARMFSSRQFAELSVKRDGRQVHRLIVTPRWARFPFMAPSDLQIGGLWTAPEARGEGLARAAIGVAHHHFGSRGARFWYLVDPSNLPSVRLAEACGYRLVGVGRRTKPAGISFLGQFKLVQIPADGR